MGGIILFPLLLKLEGGISRGEGALENGNLEEENPDIKGGGVMGG